MCMFIMHGISTAMQDYFFSADDKDVSSVQADNSSQAIALLVRDSCIMFVKSKAMNRWKTLGKRPFLRDIVGRIILNGS